MNSLIKSRTFWVATALFLLVTLAIIWLALPPALRAIQDVRKKLSEIDSQIATQQTRLETGRALKKNSAELDSLYEKASLALPKTADLDQLMLQLEGLLASLKLDATLSLPLQASSPQSTASAGPVITSNDTEVRPGGAGTTTTSPPPTEPGKKTTFTITGKYGFSDTRRLLTSLKNFSRWNKISSIVIKVSSDTSTSTVTAEVFYASSKPPEYTGTASELMEQARQALANLTSYTTAPSVEKEGNFGRIDPFAKP